MEQFSEPIPLEEKVTICDINNYLQYPQIAEQRVLFENIFKINPKCQIAINYPLQFDVEVIANKRIGYRDITKINQEHCFIPFLIFFEVKNSTRILILSNNSYIEARGMQFCITQKDGLLEKYSSNLLACNIDCEELLNVFSAISNPKVLVASQQRFLDNKYLSDPETMKDKCINLANETIEKATHEIEEATQEEKSEIIDKTIMSIFLLKKALYVKYMANQKLLIDRHSGNSKEQRVFAKSYIDEIPIISFYQLWNLDKKEENR